MSKSICTYLEDKNDSFIMVMFHNFLVFSADFTSNVQKLQFCFTHDDMKKIYKFTILMQNGRNFQ
jgi:hypothetical protein